MSAIAAFARNDLRTVGRDTLLGVVLIGPFLYAAAMWFLPTVTDHARAQWAFDLAPYHSAILSAFCVLGPPLLMGAMLALQLLDDKDQHTLTALRVTPVPPATYPTYRAAVVAALTTISVIASLALTGQVDAPTLALSVPVAVVAGLLAPVLGFVMASLGRTKIEGLAVMRVVGLAVFTLPVVPFFFLDRPWQLAFGVLPPYWPVRAFWSAYDGGTYWPYVVGGLLYNGALAALLVKVVTRRLR
ncbi:ABC transporter permease [Pseudonocardia abyssalis]|jgi:fluoroquinolone transport system permease protein|uniref:ABC transporter permease n=1 Tax=Pseudonocardia abyssalis TaxID=2792008 RepID=A0ABS6USC0_9PSEU|nr:ABC transporter permease [Pseudonocardia abyssalis]MBW0115809.1 ABC transporter permease [Pseudonocardia abyssalis]MBW0135077.1 ABC transporter permease [Pseudonocardia abyssalis]